MNQIEARRHRIEYFSYCIGLAAFIILGRLIGNDGIAYMAVIIEGISLFVLFINGRAADVIGGLIRSRRKKSQYKESDSLFKTVFLVQMISAVFSMVLYFFLTNFLAGFVFRLPFLAAAMKILPPVILFKTLQCVLQGYFQGLGSHMPTVVCSIFRQLFFLLFGLLLTGRLTEYGTKVSALLQNQAYTGMYGAVGLCIAMVISEILVSIFLLIVYIGSDRQKEKKKNEGGFQKQLAFGERGRVFFLSSLPENTASVLKKLPFLLAVILLFQQSLDSTVTARNYGLFFGNCVCVCGISVFLMLIGMCQVFTRITAFRKKKDNRSVRENIYAGLHYSWAGGIYMAVVLAVLAPQFSSLFQKVNDEKLRQYYTYAGIVTAVLVVNIFLWMVLQILGAYLMKLLVLAVFNGVFLVSYLLLSRTQMDHILALCVAVLIGALVQFLISFGYIVRKYVLQPDYVRSFIIPIFSAGIMGLVVMLIRNVLAPHVGNFMCLLLCLAVSIILYLGVLVLTKSIRESEISCIYGPLGKKIFEILIR